MVISNHSCDCLLDSSFPCLYLPVKDATITQVRRPAKGGEKKTLILIGLLQNCILHKLMGSCIFIWYKLIHK